MFNFSDLDQSKGGKKIFEKKTMNLFLEKFLGRRNKTRAHSTMARRHY